MLEHPILAASARYGVRLGLTRMRSYLGVLGDPHLAVPVVHVAGTNGKGSVVRMVAEILMAHGLRVGELCSPHLQHVNERIRVDGVPIPDLQLDALLHELIDARQRWEALLGEPPSTEAPAAEQGALLTYFELMTAGGFLHVARQGVDVSVVEVGMGGRLDATNVVAPLATAIVTIGVDHTAELGPDLASIAAEKAGIIKKGVPVVLGPLESSALRVIRAMAADREAPVRLPGEGYRISVDRSGLLTFTMGETVLGDLQLRLPGVHQRDNAGVALALSALALAAPELGARSLDPAACREALARVQHAGRLEWLGPNLLLDAAHNPAGAGTLAGYLRALPRDRPRTLLLGASDDKDVRSMVVALEGVIDRVITTHCSHPRARPAGALAESLVGIPLPVLPAGPIEEALPLALAQEGLVIAAGSIFLTGAVRELVGTR